MYELCEDCVADGITYAEIRFSPILHTLEELNLSAGTPNDRSERAIASNSNHECQPATMPYDTNG